MKKRSVGVTAIIVLISVAAGGCGNSNTTPTSTTTTTLRHHVGPESWTRVVSANFGTSHNVLSAVTLINNQAWAVGDWFNGKSDQTLVEHQYHEGWRVVVSPNASSKHNELDSVSGTSSRDVWAVGRYQPSVGQERTLIEHWDGSTWKIVPSPNVGSFHNELDSVVAITPDDVWAVGHYDRSSIPADKALIEHWDGTLWNVVPAPVFLGPISDLMSIAATPKGGPLWAVGSQTFGHRTISLMCEFVGGVWRVVPSPNHGPYDNVLRGVAAVSLRDVWAVGSADHNGTSFAVTMHWDGLDIDLERVPRILTTHYTLEAIATDSLRRVFAVGEYFSGHTIVSAILEWRSNQWQIDRLSRIGFTHNQLLGVASSTKSPPVAVGIIFSGSADKTLVMTCNC